MESRSLIEWGLEIPRDYYYSKGEQMAWDDREIIAQFLCRDEAAS